MLFAPVDNEGLRFEQVDKINTINLSFTNTVIPPKEKFFNQNETLFQFTGVDNRIEIKEKSEEEVKSVIFGIRACDLRGINLLDKVFLTTYTDSLYSIKRENTLLIGVSCNEIYENCFCDLMGVNPFSGDGSDVFLYPFRDEFLIEINSTKGEKLIKNYNPVLTAVKDEDRIKYREMKNKLNKGRKSLNTVKFKTKFQSLWDNEIWREMSKICIACGICTFLCPTCHCFNVFDEKHKDSGERIRIWDSCLSKEFSQMAGGENPFSAQWEKIRHRFFHKFSYIPENYGVPGCTGCGRCLRHCPVKIDIREIIKKCQ